MNHFIKTLLLITACLYTSFAVAFNPAGLKVPVSTKFPGIHGKILDIPLTCMVVYDKKPWNEEKKQGWDPESGKGESPCQEYENMDKNTNAFPERYMEIIKQYNEEFKQIVLGMKIGKDQAPEYYALYPNGASMGESKFMSKCDIDSRIVEAGQEPAKLKIVFDKFKPKIPAIILRCTLLPAEATQ